MARGAWVDPRAGKIPFAEWVTRWEASLSNLRPTTRALNVGIARNYLLPRFGPWSLAAITTNDVKVLLADSLASGVSTSAARRRVLVLSTILEAAVADGRIARNPCKGVKLPPEASRPMRFLEAEDVARLSAAAPQHYRPLILTAAYVGLRWVGCDG